MAESAMPCGCDPGASHICDQHQTLAKQSGFKTWCGVPVLAVPAGVDVNEIRVVDPNTGGEKGQKLERFDLVPNEFERALARHYGVGSRKYADRNWEKGYAWGLSVGALRRHLAAWLAGEDNDPETGSNHLIAVAWHAAALYVFQLRGLGTDDVRSKPVV
jgi:hypothetical protein